MIYKFRAILDAEEDIFRDIAIADSDTLEDLHNALVNAFGFDGSEGGSFFTCDENWEQHEEIPLFDMGDVPGEQKTMADYILSNILFENETKILYVYDPFNMWTFFVELAAIENETDTDETELPALLFAHGVLPAEAPVKDFNAPISNDDMFGDFDDDYDDEDFDMFDGDEDFSDMGYDENAY